jgi:hypothetical protein
MKHIAVVIDWYGPYTTEEALTAARNDGYSRGLYMAFGKGRYQRQAIAQYVGLSTQLSVRLANNRKLPDITRDKKIWLGEAVTAEPAGKRTKFTAASLDYAEWLHAYFMKLPMNSKKRVKPPPRSVTVLNHWWKKDYETPWVRRPDPAWPDLIDYVGSDYPAKLVWFGSRLKRIRPPFDES